MKKKFLATALCIALIGLSACSSNNTTGDSAAAPTTSDAPAGAATDVVLELWYWQSALNDGLIEQVPQQFPGVSVNGNKFNSENMEEKVITALASSSPMPDILAMDDWVSNVLPSADQFYNLYEAPFNAAEYQDRYVDWKWKKAETSDGEKLIAIPIDAGPTAMFYRADLFEAAGLPSDPAEVATALSTWDQALEAAKTMKEKTGVSMFDFTKNIFWMMMSQGDKQLLDTEDKFIGDQEHVKTAFYTAAAFSDYVFGMDNMYIPEWGAALDSGDVAAYCSAIWTRDMLINVTPATSGQWRVTRMPGGPGNYGGSCLGIPATSQHAKEAFDVIVWMENDENQLVQVLENSLFPTNLTTLDSPELLVADEFFGGQVINEIFVDAVKNVVPQYVGLNYHAYRQNYYDQLQMVQDQGKDVDQAWADALQGCSDLEAIS